MAWSTIPAHIIQPPTCCIVLVSGTSEFNKTNPFAHPSGPSNITWHSSMKTTLEKSVFIYFLAKFWRFKCGFYAMTRFSLCSSRRSKFFKSFPLFRVLNVVIFQQLSLSFNDLYKTSFISIKSTVPHSVTLLFSVFRQLLDLSFYPCFNKYYEEK